MCIEEVKSFRFGGKLYSTELEAVKAALSEIGTRIVKDHAANPMEGLVKHGADVSRLRARYIELSPAPTAVDSASEEEPTTLLEAADG